jgi:hypothetical protein
MPATTQTDRFTHDTETTPRETTARGSAPAPAPAAGPGPLADLGLLIGRLLVGFVMAAHGYQKVFDIGPAAFGTSTLDPLGVPMPEAMGYLRSRSSSSSRRRRSSSRPTSRAPASSSTSC